MNSRFRYYSVLFISVLLVVGISCDDDDDNPGNGDDNEITLDVVAEGLASPLVIMEAPDNSDRLFIVDQGGQIYIHRDGAMMAQPFLDISAKMIARQGPQDERGLLGLAFHPDFANNGRLFVFYS